MESKATKDKDRSPHEELPKIIYLSKEASADLVENFDSLGYVRSALASKYEIIDEIARTDTATVFRAVHVQLGREVALKVLLRATAQDRGYADMFHRRCRAIDKLSQSNIIRVYDEGVESGIHYMAMEYLKGSTLEGRISKQGPMPHEVVIGLLMPAISALDHAHHNALVHGDIKCSSIFLHNDGRVILNGFGIQYGTKGTRALFRRSPNALEYLSPEEAAGNGADTRSDIYSLGVVMYHALTGRFPYSEATPEDTVKAILSDLYLPVSDYTKTPPWLESVVDRCLQSDPSRRVQSCAELLVLLNGSSKVDIPHVVQDQEDVLSTGDGVGFRSSVTEPAPETPRRALRNEDKSEANSDAARPGAKLDGSVVSPNGKVRPLKKSTAYEAKRTTSAHEVPKERKRGNRIRVLPWLLTTVVLMGLAAATAVVVYSLSLTQKNTVQGIVDRGSTSEPETENTPPARENAVPKNRITQKNSELPVPAPGGTETGQSKIPAENVSPSAKIMERRPAVRKAAESVKVKTGKDIQKPSGPKGPTVVEVSLPDVTGNQLGVAKRILLMNGFILGHVTIIPDPANDGLVVRELPKPGSRVRKGSIVNLIIGSK